MLEGDERLRAVKIENGTKETERIPVAAMFVMIGADPCTAWLRGAVALDEHDFVLTGVDAARDGSSPLPSPFQTSELGVFAVGDVRSGSVKRVASAVGEGSVVVSEIHRYLARLNGGEGQH